MECLIAVLLLILIAVMVVETRCLSRTCERSQSSSRNWAVAAAIRDSGALRLRVFRVEVPHRSSKALREIVRSLGLDTIQTTAIIFTGTDAGYSGGEE